MAHFDKGRKYKFFPRTAEAETFYLSGEGMVKNWTGDGRIRKIERHERYDEFWVQFGYRQRKKWLVVIFKHLRVIFGTLKENDMVHMTGTVDRWGKRRVYVVTGIIKYPHPTITELKDHSLDMELYKAQVKSQEEVEIESFVNHRLTDGYKFKARATEEDDASNMFFIDDEEEGDDNG
jgi:hypothetical protein